MTQLWKQYHYALYQLALALIGLMAVLRILFDYTLLTALGYSVLTIASYAAGQTIVGLFQRRRAAARSRSVD